MELEMSRPTFVHNDIQRLQGQLFIAIHHHQTLVAQLKNHPENTGVKKQILELQNHMKNLSDNQKVLLERLKCEKASPPEKPNGKKGDDEKVITKVFQTPSPVAESPPEPISAEKEEGKGIGVKREEDDDDSLPQGFCTLPAKHNLVHQTIVSDNRRSPVEVVPVSTVASPTACVSKSQEDDLTEIILNEMLPEPLSSKVEFMLNLGMLPSDMVDKFVETRLERKQQLAKQSKSHLWTWEMHEHKRRKSVYLRGGSPPILRKRGRLRRENSIGSGPSSPCSSSGEPVCFICRATVTSKQAVICSGCSCYHQSCMKNSDRKESASEEVWKCRRCGGDAMTTAAKERERERLRERNDVLNKEKDNLEKRMKVLKKALQEQEAKKSELTDTEQNTKESINKLSNFIQFIKCLNPPT